MFSIREILKDSLPVLIAASAISLIAGIFLQRIEEKLLVILPLIVILPALNDMIGDFGIIMTSRITTVLYKKQGKKKEKIIAKHLLHEIIPIAIFSAGYISVLAIVISHLRSFPISFGLLWRVLIITGMTTLTLVLLVFFLAVGGSIYVYKRKLDPDDILIPITTSVADLGSVAVFSFLVSFLF